MKTLSIFVLTLIFSVGLTLAQDTLIIENGKPCPPEGLVKAKGKKKEELEKLNRLKNRYRFPEIEDIDTSITLKSLLKEGDDRNRFNENKAVIVNGYVYEVKMGSVETCNCKSKSPQFRDTHIELILSTWDHEKEMRVIAEVTPRMRNQMAKRGVDWSTAKLKETLTGKFVSIEGWLLLDAEHLNDAYNTDSLDIKGNTNWRATAWEIHPVTEIRVY
ncbi:MAG: hypothetical protein HYY40_02085 [Bacteroidetes bacterium]|nr:hypothetical protein [Bacteroidota bacterium]